MLGSTVTPDASPPISMPLFVLPENTLVWTSMLPPVEVISIPSLPLAALAAEREQAAERIEGDQVAGGIAHLNPILAVAGRDVAQRDHTADGGVGGCALYQNAVEVIGENL